LFAVITSLQKYAEASSRVIGFALPRNNPIA